MYCRLSRSFARVAGSVRWFSKNSWIEWKEAVCTSLAISRSQDAIALEEAGKGCMVGVACATFLQMIEVF
jgi:hypothetical protein